MAGPRGKRRGCRSSTPKARVVIFPAILLGALVGLLMGAVERQGANWKPGRASRSTCANKAGGVPSSSLSRGLIQRLTVNVVY